MLKRFGIGLHGKTLAKFVALCCCVALVIGGISQTFASDGVYPFSETEEAGGSPEPGAPPADPPDDGTKGAGESGGEEQGGGTGEGAGDGNGGAEEEGAGEGTGAQEGTLPSNGEQSQGKEAAPDEKLLSKNEKEIEMELPAAAELLLLADLRVDAIGALQAAVDAAADGDVITLTTDFAAALENENAPLTISVAGDKSLTFDAGAAGVLKTGHTGAHFDFRNTGSGQVTLSGFQIDGQGTGGGLILSGKTCIVDSYFADCTNRAVTALERTDLKAERCTFEANTGGAISYRGGNVGADTAPKTRRTLEVIDCSFLNNVITVVDGYLKGAAIGTPFIGWDGMDCYTVNVTRSVFTGNKVIATSTVADVANNVDGGAIAIVNGRATAAADRVYVNIEDSTFEGNFAQDDGGAILVEGALTSTAISSYIRNCTFSGNSCAGAAYWRSMFTLKAGVTDGCGGAVCYYGLTDSEIANSTFYGNAVTHALPAGLSLFMDYGSVGGGGAIGVDTKEDISDPAEIPDYPKLSNNIFVGNKHVKPTTQAQISSVNSLANNKLGNMQERSKTGNVFILPVTDRDIQSPDTRGPANNGNIGYDNGNHNGANSYGSYYDNNGVSLTGIPASRPGGGTISIPITPETVFAHTTGSGIDAVPTKELYGSAGAPGHTAQHFCYTPSPLSDEMYRDGSGPYYDPEVRRDTRGYQRDHYPNAGAVEIYWTKFDPGVEKGGEWIASEVDFTALGGIQSRLDANIYYLVATPPPVGGGSPGAVTTFPRTSFELSSSVLGDPAYLDWGFQGWKSNQPDAPGGSVYTPVQTGISVVSGKQTFTAQWEQDFFRVDWNPNYSGSALLTPTLRIAKNAKIDAISPAPTRTGYELAGWYKDAACTTAWSFTSDTVTVDRMLYAMWVPLHTITYDANGGTAVTAIKQLATGSVYGAHPTTTRSGYSFLGWYTQASGGSRVTAESVVTNTADHTLYAQWQQNAPQTFTVRFVDHDGTLLKTETVARGGSATPPSSPSRASWSFSGWSGVYTNVLADQTVTATYHYNGSPQAQAQAPTQQSPRPPAPAPTASAPVVTQPAPAPAPEPEPEPIPEPAIPETLMNDGRVPLGGFFQTGVWALLNLILVLAGILIAFIRLVTSRKQQQARVESGAERLIRLVLPVVLALVVSLASLVFFLLLENFSKPMVWLDNRTLPIAAFFLAEMVLVAVSRVRHGTEA